MIYLYLLIYLFTIPLTAIVIVKYKLDPFDNSLHKPNARDQLAWWACFWPLLWVIYLLCWVSQGMGFVCQRIVAGITAITAPYDEED